MPETSPDREERPGIDLTPRTVELLTRLSEEGLLQVLTQPQQAAEIEVRREERRWQHQREMLELAGRLVLPLAGLAIFLVPMFLFHSDPKTMMEVLRFLGTAVGGAGIGYGVRAARESREGRPALKKGKTHKSLPPE